MDKKYTKILLLPLLGVLILGGSSCADPWKENVPDFEVCDMEELPKTKAQAENRNYLMWWTLLGIIPAEEKPFSPEQEAILSGRSNAPSGCRFHHHLFQKDKEKGLKAGEVHISKLFRKYPLYRKQGKFYACISVRCPRSMKDVSLIGTAAGSMKVWLNGQAVLEHPGNKTGTVKKERLSLRSGYNRIVVRYIDNRNFDPDNRKFSLRFTGKEGNPMFVR